MIAALSLALSLSLPLPTAQVADLVRHGDAGRAFALLAEQLDDERVKPGDPGAAYYARLLRYLRCEDPGVAEVSPGVPDSAGFRAAGELFAVEKLRLSRRQRERNPSGPEAWIAARRLHWDLPPRQGGDDHFIRWVVTDERWNDEAGVVTAPQVMCGGVDGKIGGRKKAKGKAGAGGERTGAEMMFDEAEAVRSLRLRLAPGTPVRIALFLDEAVLRARLGEWKEVWVLVRLLDEEGAVAGAGRLSDLEAVEHTFLSGLAAEAEQRDEDAVARWERAAALPLTDEQRWFVDLHRQRLLVDTGRLAEAKEVLDAATAGERGAGEVGRYLKFRGAFVRFRMGDEAGLLASARELVGRRPAAQIAADPIGRGAEELIYLMLAAHPFNPALLEVVESLGPVNEVFRRLDTLAALAFDHGRAALAAGIYAWLLEHHKLDYLRPYYLGRLSASGAAQGDHALFATHFHALIDETLRPPPPPPPPPPATRSSSSSSKRKGTPRRNIEWDRQILLTTRDAVAALAARRDGAGLRALTSDLQRYLRSVGDRPPYREITRLYRLASTQLPSGPRGYAEKVGAEHAPVWLGDVTLDRPRTVVVEPELPVPPLYGPETLLCIPDGSGRCPRWLGPDPRPPSAPAALKKDAEKGVPHAR